MALPTSQNAFLVESSRGAFAIRPRPVPAPGAGQVLVKIASAALNPVDWIIRAMGLVWAPYPAVLGFDAAGEVVQRGDGVTQFAVGDRM